MQNLMHAYHVGTPIEVKAAIASWEAKLNTKVVNDEIPETNWEHIIQDPGHTHGPQTLFRQTIQLYWVMKKLLAKAMTTYKDREEPEEDKQEELKLKYMQKEIQSVQMQQYHHNLNLKKVEKQIQSLLHSDVPGSSAKYLAPIDSSNE